jgi:hypothetical protein
VPPQDVANYALGERGVMRRGAIRRGHQLGPALIEPKSSSGGFGLAVMVPSSGGDRPGATSTRTDATPNAARVEKCLTPPTSSRQAEGVAKFSGGGVSKWVKWCGRLPPDKEVG